MGLTFPGTGAQMELLWQNPSPTSSFPTQNLDLDLSSYKAVLIRYRDATNSAAMLESGIYFVDNTRSLMVQVGEQSKNNLIRSVRLEANAIHFGDCIGPQGNTLNTVAVPYQIYGLQF